MTAHNEAMLAMARRLRDAYGLSVIPLDHPDSPIATDPKEIGKTPAVKWKAFQTAHPTNDNFVAWFNGKPRNLAILTGPLSAVVAFDSDTPAGETWVGTNLPPTPFATLTSRGLHRLYRHPGGDVPVPNKKGFVPGVDIRGDGGYVVAPGSVHASGHRYREATPWPDSFADMPTFKWAWLGREAPAAPRTASQTPPQTARLLDDFTRLRIQRYLAATPPAIEGQGGDAHTFQVCCRVVRGFALSAADAFDLLAPWNARCRPTWSTADLMEKIDGALLYGDEPIGGRRDAAREVPDPLPMVPSTFNQTDSGNAELLANRDGHRLRYDHRLQRWLLWAQHHWLPDREASVRRLAKAAMRARFQSAFDLRDADKQKHEIKHALQSEGRRGLDAMLYLAQAETPIATDGDGWDADPWLLGVRNGVVQLETGALRAGRQSDHITRQAGVTFDPRALCPRWDRFLLEVFADDEDVIAFVQKAAGYSLTGITTEQVLFLLHGYGSNGKESFVNTLLRLLGDYGMNTPFSTLELHQRAAIPNDLAALAGRRYIIAAETNDGTRLNEARVKALTGCDPITARFLHGEFFTFDPVAKFWLSVNHKPVVKDDSHGFWRRIRLIPFTQTFEKDTALGATLAAEAPGILAWAVRGCLLWQAEGLTPPKAIADATAMYRIDSDPLGEFLAEACDCSDPSATIGVTDLFKGYVDWAGRKSITDRDRIGSKTFSQKVAERFKKKRLPAGVFLRGIRLGRQPEG